MSLLPLEALLDPGIRVVSVEPLGGLSAETVRVVVEGLDVPALIVKRGVADTDAKRSLYARERQVYDTLSLPGAPPCRRVVNDPVTGQFGLVLDEVPGVHPHDGLDALDAARVLDAVRALHRTEAPDDWPVKGFGDREACVTKLRRGFAALDRARFAHPDNLPARTVHTLAAGWDGFVGAPRVLLHSDLHPENVLVAPDRITLVDWQNTALGPAAVDLAGVLVTTRPDAHAAVRPALEDPHLATALAWIASYVVPFCASEEAPRVRTEAALQGHWARLVSGLTAGPG